MSAPGTFFSSEDVVTKKDAQLTFKAGSNEFSISVTGGTTLSELRNQINTSEDNFGVSANLVDDGSGNLFFTATSSIEGAGNTLKIINSSPVIDADGNPIVDTPVEESEEVVDDAPVDDEPVEEIPIDETDELDIAGDDYDFANDGPIPADEVKDPAETNDAIIPPKAEDSETSIDGESADAAVLAQNSSSALNSLSTEGVFAGLYTPLGDEARDAIITVDGIQIRNDTNTFDNAVAGLSIEALAPTDKTTKVDISFDQKTVQETIKEFIDSYNDIVGLLQASSDKGAVLSGNSMIRNLQSSLSTQLMSSHGDSGTFTSIFDLGVKMDNKGQLSFNDAKFNEAMKRGYSEIAPLISGDNGLAQSLETLLDNYTGSGGMTNSLKDSVRRSIDNTEGTLEAYEDRMVKYEESLRSKFTSLDSRLAEMNSQGGYLNSVLAKM
jgi:flagellar hook-associated protein 2